METALQRKLASAEERYFQLRKRQAQKDNVLRFRENTKKRKARNRRMYELGGMVEKMGLDGLGNDQLLGLFHYLHSHLATLPDHTLDAIWAAGSDYMAKGKRMPRLRGDS